MRKEVEDEERREEEGVIRRLRKEKEDEERRMRIELNSSWSPPRAYKTPTRKNYDRAVSLRRNLSDSVFDIHFIRFSVLFQNFAHRSL